MGDFVHLHLHSEYSLLDGACRISDIPKAAKACGQNAVAITDHGVMYGVVGFYKACIKEGIRPIIGCEVYVAKRSMYDREKEHDYGSCHLILLVKNKTGWDNLITLVSKAFTDGFYSKPRIDNELLERHSEGLVCLSACLAGYIPRCIVSGDYEKAQAYALRLDKMFGRGNFYLEIQDHGLRDDNIVCDGIRKISESTGIPMVATNDVHYLKRSDSETQAILMCIQTNNVITDGKPIGFETDEFYFKTTAEMERLFRDYENACENTQKIADMCSFDFEFGKTELPRYTPENGMKPEEYLTKLAHDGLDEKIKNGNIILDNKYAREMYEERIKYELSVIFKMGYGEYYLIVWDFVHHSKNEGIPVGPGRGSGAGSIVAYLIGITDIDSIKFDLLFERFLNPERISMPDFDIDFCYDRRDEAIAYVREKYGEDHTAQIITFGTLAARAALRDVGRALGMSYADVDAVAKQIPQIKDMTLKKALDNEKLKTMYDSDPAVRKLIDTASELEGMPRHASTHAAGVVITERPLTEYVPIAVNNGITVTQFDMDTVAELGLLKFDFLALRYLTIINNAIIQIKENDPSFDIEKADYNDTATYDMLSRGQSYGVFQLESSGMKQMLTQLKPQSLDDIIAAIALYRPGPMDSIPKYIEAKHDASKIHYCTSKLAPILDVTYGCIVYQEQVMQIFREIAGYSFGHADVVRRAISKKKQGVLDGERQAFIDGAVKLGVSEKDATDLFEDIVSFANYAFNKSHAAAYGVLAFRTAYLKNHYQREYESALLTSVISSSDKLNEYINDCKKNGIVILPPDINKSRGVFHVENGAIRFGLTALKNVGAAMIDQMVAERKNNGDYADIYNFIERTAKTGLNKRQLETFIKSGALDTLGIYRSRLLAVYENLLEKNSDTASSLIDGQIGMFDTGKVAMPKPKTVEFPQIPEYSAREKLTLEKESCGIYLSGHVLDDYKKNIESLNPTNIMDIRRTFKTNPENDSEDTGIVEDVTLNDLSPKSKVTVVGTVTKRTNKSTKNGGQMAFVTLEDKTSSIELICFPTTLTKYSPLLAFDSVIGVEGTLSVREDEDPKILVNSVIRLKSDSDFESPAVPGSQDGSNVEHTQNLKQTAESAKPVTKVFIRVSSEDSDEFKRLSALCEIFTGGVPAVFYTIDNDTYHKPPVMISATPFVINELVGIAGKDNVVVK